MKKFAITLCVLGMMAVPMQSVMANSGKACTPTNIQYCKKGKTWSGKKYTTYTVRCSDGTKRTISAWNKRKTWCVGEKQKSCSRSQLEAAKRACRS